MDDMTLLCSKCNKRLAVVVKVVTFFDYDPEWPDLNWEVWLDPFSDWDVVKVFCPACEKEWQGGDWRKAIDNGEMEVGSHEEAEE